MATRNESEMVRGFEQDGNAEGQVGSEVGSDNPVGTVGQTPYMCVVGTVPSCGFAGAKLLGRNPFDKGGRDRPGYYKGKFVGYPGGSSLYVLRDGSFCDVNGGIAEVIPANQIRSYVEQTGCVWKFTPSRLACLYRLILKQDGDAKPYVC